ncbi:hypothetical protein O181_062954 [Austropuccinia psidii MF-1]|uniref:Uncharacterized protein n=1 Tax=Austropuccinia psidii MF-1 TaxID=1389203 RepID=A0A9Q3I221_9BASI|nr:hypothetical protein [Austropuccinia psidii MF-1]
MPIISKRELELSMSDSNRDKSYSEASNRCIHEALKAVLHRLQKQRLGNASINPPKSDELLKHPQEVPERGLNCEILQFMESTLI